MKKKKKTVYMEIASDQNGNSSIDSFKRHIPFLSG